MIDRTILSKIEDSIRLRPVTLITGARQVGKTTLCGIIAKKHGFEYVTLADIKERNLAMKDPEMFIASHAYPLIIDEAQYAKGLFDAIESVVDKKKFENGENSGMYVLTGSQMYRLMEGVSQSMAGRVGIIEMSPLSYSEAVGREEVPFTPDPIRCIERSKEYVADADDVFLRIVRGGYPELYEKSGLKSSKFYSDYVETYLARDVSEIINIKDKVKFMTFLQTVASFTGQELVLEKISNVVGVSKVTVSSWLNVLQLGGMIRLLRPYSERSAVKRIIKRPKMYFCDTGLACYLAGIYDASTLARGYLKGPMMETYVVNEIMKSYSNNTEPAGFFYYRDSNNNEIDLLLLRNGVLSMIECKAGMTFDSKDVKAFDRIGRSGYEIGPSCVICLTDKAYPIKDGIYAFPVTSI